MKRRGGNEIRYRTCSLCEVRPARGRDPRSRFRDSTWGLTALRILAGPELAQPAEREPAALTGLRRPRILAASDRGRGGEGLVARQGKGQGGVWPERDAPHPFLTWPAHSQAVAPPLVTATASSAGTRTAVGNDRRGISAAMTLPKLCRNYRRPCPAIVAIRNVRTRYPLDCQRCLTIAVYGPAPPDRLKILVSAVQSRPCPPFFSTSCPSETFRRSEFVPRCVPTSGTLWSIPAHEQAENSGPLGLGHHGSRNHTCWEQLSS